MTRSEVLERAYDMVKEQDHWCQRVLRSRIMDKSSNVVGFAYCLSGATWEQTGNCERHLEVMMLLSQFTRMRDAVYYNDTHKHWQVLRLLRVAIAHDKAGGREARDAARRQRQTVIAMRKKALRNAAIVALGGLIKQHDCAQS